MAKLGTVMAIAGVVIVSIGAGVGGTLAGMHLWAQHSKAAAAAPRPLVPKPIYFADLSDVVVSLPPEADQPATSYVSFGIEFATTDQKAVAAFGNYQPIIKAGIISLLMAETGDALQQPQVRATLIQNCLAVANEVLKANDAAGQTPPFGNAYITDLVIQD
jgi:flagellar basal body-associated protein FliL